jgi:hypothetical protein
MKRDMNTKTNTTIHMIQIQTQMTKVNQNIVSSKYRNEMSSDNFFFLFKYNQK